MSEKMEAVFMQVEPKAVLLGCKDCQRNSISHLALSMWSNPEQRFSLNRLETPVCSNCGSANVSQVNSAPLADELLNREKELSAMLEDVVTHRHVIAGIRSGKLDPASFGATPEDYTGVEAALVKNVKTVRQALYEYAGLDLPEAVFGPSGMPPLELPESLTLEDPILLACTNRCPQEQLQAFVLTRFQWVAVVGSFWPGATKDGLLCTGCGKPSIAAVEALPTGESPVELSLRLAMSRATTALAAIAIAARDIFYYAGNRNDPAFVNERKRYDRYCDDLVQFLLCRVTARDLMKRDPIGSALISALGTPVYASKAT